MRSLLALAVTLTLLAGLYRSQGGTAGLSADAASGSLTGVLFAPAPREYRFRVTADGTYRLVLDGHPVLSTDGADGGRASGAITLERGQHAVSIEFRPRVEGARADLAWNGESIFRFDPVHPAAFAVSSQSDYTWRMRHEATPLAGAASVAWSALLVWAFCRLGWRVVPRLGLEATPAVIATAGALALLAIVGVDWGMPDGRWAADEFFPGYVRHGWARRFSGGWSDGYPPFHFYLLCAVYSPAMLFAEVGWLGLDTPATDDLLFLQGRLLTLVFATGVIVGTMALARRLTGAASAWASGLWLGLTVPFVFYSKTANLEIPYLFWFVVSMLFLAAFRDSGLRRHLTGFCVTAVFCVTTKDQAFALYALPVCWLVYQAVRDRSPFTLALAAGVGAITFALVYNLPANWQGFLEHIRIITGPASVDYRMFLPTLAGQLSLAAATARLIPWTIGVPGLLICLYGAAIMWSRRDERRLLILLGVGALSYYVLFIGIVGYVYDRFLLPAILLAAIPAGVGLSAALASTTAARVPRFVAIGLVAWMGWRGLSVDALLLRDARYTAEQFLETRVAPGDVVASLQQTTYLPRLRRFNHAIVAPDVAATLRLAPAFVVCNTEFLARYPAQSGYAKWLQWLASADGPYVEVFRYKDPLGGWAFGEDPVFIDRVESPFINLDKANPETVIFQRK